MKVYKIYAILILIGITLIGMPSPLETPSNQNVKEVKVQSHSTKYRVVNNKIYKIFDAGIYQDIQTGEISDAKTLELSYSFSSFTFKD